MVYIAVATGESEQVAPLVLEMAWMVSALVT
jgi:hypothetical protein